MKKRVIKQHILFKEYNTVLNVFKYNETNKNKINSKN